jgi:hypothetical protein
VLLQHLARLIADSRPARFLPPPANSIRIAQRIKGGRGLGNLVFDAPGELLTATLKGGLLNEVTASDRSDGQLLVRPNLGVKRSIAKEIIDAMEG